MNSTKQSITCPACKSCEIDVSTYSAMMVLREDVALFTLTCPACNAKVSALQHIPANLRTDIAQAACEVGAGMCRV